MKTDPFPIIDIKRYGGRQVAIVRGKIVASGRSTSALLRAAKKKVPGEDHGRIALFLVPKSMTVVYRL